MTKPRVAFKDKQELYNLEEFVNFKVVIHDNSHGIPYAYQDTYLPCDTYDDASKLFRTLMLSKRHNHVIKIVGQKKCRMIGSVNKAAQMVSCPIVLIRATVLWNGEGMNNPYGTRENYVWTLQEDHLGWADMWHLLDGRF